MPCARTSRAGQSAHQEFTTARHQRRGDPYGTRKAPLPTLRRGDVNDLSLISLNPSLASVAIPGQQYVNAEFVYAARHEMATSLTDLLTRRTRAHRCTTPRATLKSAHDIARLVATELQWSDART